MSSTQSQRRRPRASVRTIREAAAAAILETSLRQVARDADLSAPVLSAFLAGAEPRDPTLRKLREWYFSEAATRGGPSLASAKAAVDLLTIGLGRQERRMCVLGILTILHEKWTRRGTPVPAWLAGLMEEMHPPASGDAP